MCLGELAEVLRLRGPAQAEVRVGPRTVTVSLLTLDGPVHEGDRLLVHSGYALARLTEDEAAEAERIRRGDPGERDGTVESGAESGTVESGTVERSP